MFFNLRLLGITFGLVAILNAAWAAPVPCRDGSRDLSIDNGKVLDMKRAAPQGVAIRAFVSGRVTRNFAERKNGHGTVHDHFEIQIGNSADDVLEVVYSEDFGEMPAPKVGAFVEACGDFINASAKNRGYDPSPSGAIIHWVHQSNSSRHDSGFVMIGDDLYGNGEDRNPRKFD